MIIRIGVIDSFKQSNIAAVILEVSATLNAVGLFSDLEIDEQVLLQELIDEPTKFGLTEDDIERYEEEPFAAANEVREILASEIFKIITDRASELGDAYPFTIDPASRTMNLKDADQIDESGLSVIALGLHNLLRETELVQISSDDRKEFGKIFAKMFEYISALALSAEVEGYVWSTGPIRSSRKLVKQLSHVTKRIGSGQPKEHHELEAHEVDANDGGIDALAIKSNDGKIAADCVLYLLGATIQSGDRKNKIIGHDKIVRFRRFFKVEAEAALQGIHAIPFPRQETEALRCRDANCRYFPLEVILRNLRQHASIDRHKRYTPYLNRISRNILVYSRSLSEVVTMELNGTESVASIPPSCGS